MPSDWIEKQFDELKKRAEERFAPLSQAETKMLRAAIAGETAWCGPSRKNDDPHNDPSSDKEWAAEREIRAEVLRWLCIDKAAKDYVDLRGVVIHGAKISGDVNLSGALLNFPFVLNFCRCSSDFCLISAELTFLDLSGTSCKGIRADRLKVKGNVFLKDGFSADGEVRLIGAQIDGSLNCDGGVFKNPPIQNVKESGTALNVQSGRVNGNVNLRNGFRAEGEVWLLGAEIGGSLDCACGSFTNPPLKDTGTSGNALVAENANIKGDLFLCSRFHAQGVVWLNNAQIGGTLDCHGGSFKNPAQEEIKESGKALFAVNARIRDIFLRDTFQADGEVNLSGAQIAGDLDCNGGTFTDLITQRATIQGVFFWVNIKDPSKAKLDMNNSAVSTLVDQEESWPAKIVLDGFVYGRIADSPTDCKTRLPWLNRQTTFTPQPYRQLAKVLRDEGDDTGARRMLYEMEKKKHRDIRHGPAQVWNVIFRGTIGYGIYPRRALWWLLLLIAIGWGTYRYGYSSGAIAPTNEIAYKHFQKNQGPPSHYQHFFALVYSAEHCFPLVNLGQKEAWTPDPNRLGLATVLRLFRWSQIFLGWTLATFFVAGVTGIARKD
jgi:hypothetical protein